MENMIRKTISCSVVEVEDRILDFVGSSEEPDRMGDIVRVNGWKLDNYLKNPVFMWAHDYKSPPIGKCVKVWKSKGELKFRIEFAPKETYEFADTCYKLYKGGYLNAVSVGFAPDEEGCKDIDGGGYEYTSQELLELSGVPIPANADALVSARQAKVITMKEFKAVDRQASAEKTMQVMSNLGSDLHKAESENIIPKPKEISQEEIKDEIDYVKSIIQSGDVNDGNKELLKSLLVEISRFLGCDNPIDIKDTLSIEKLGKLFETAKNKSFGG
jgi:uncharacterized protein